MRISILGLGYVGVVSGACLARLGHEVLGVDINQDKIRLLNEGVSPIVEEGIAELIREGAENGRLRASDDTEYAILNTDLSMVSVGTPSAPNGSLHFDYVEAVTQQMGAALRKKEGPHAIAYRSTMLPGVMEERVIPMLEEHSGRKCGVDLHVCFNPEFLREGSSVSDFENPPYTIAGSNDPRAMDILEEVYAPIDAAFLRTSFGVAESVKYLANIYHALKICFANEAGRLLSHLGVDSRDAAAVFCEDTVLNVSKAYLRPGFAFGGSCLPKDLRSFLFLAKDNDLDLPMLRGVMESNVVQIEKAYDLVAKHGRGKVAFFGLSFKPGTDDLRESPFVRLAEMLIGKGFELKIFDPCVEAARLTGSNKAYIEREIPHFEQMMQADPAAALDGADVILLGHARKEDQEAILQHAGKLPLVDLQGSKKIQEAWGDTYHGIAW